MNGSSKTEEVARETLRQHRERVGPLYPGNPKTAENSRGQDMTRIRRATGLARKDNAHRHSYGSYRLAITKNCSQVALEMGNRQRKVVQSYNDPQSKEDAAAYFALRPTSLENVVPMPFRSNLMGRSRARSRPKGLGATGDASGKW